MPKLNDYLNGKPLNKRLERLAAGEDEIDAAEKAAIHLVDAKGLDRYEREDLKKLTFEPGWPILLNLLDKAIQEKENLLRRSSKVNPLEDANALAAEWAKLASFEEFRRMMVAVMDAEIEKLGAKKAEDEGGDGEILG